MAYDHADPEFKQLEVLQRVINRIQQGQITRVDVDWDCELIGGKQMCIPPLQEEELREWVTAGYIWFDYFCVPQTVGYDFHAGADLMNAVNSIPAYIEQCQHFIVLCPPLEHVNKMDCGQPAVNDYASWARRGWCRAEASARLLARRSGPMIKIESAEGTPTFIVPFEAWFSQPGLGEYTCCEMGHTVSRKDPETAELATRSIPCDKWKVGGIMHQLFDKKIMTLQQELDGEPSMSAERRRRLLLELRMAAAFRAHMLLGLETDDEIAARIAARNADQCLAFREFMAANRFDQRSKTETGATADKCKDGEEYLIDGDAEDHRRGWTPLRFAAIADNLPVARELLCRGADVHAPSVGDLEHAMNPGESVLGSAAGFASADMVRLLVAAGADSGGVDALGMPPIVCALAAERSETVAALLESSARWERTRDGFGMTALLWSLFLNNGHHSGECARALLQHGGAFALDDRTTGLCGMNPVMAAAAAKRGSASVLAEVLGDARCGIDVNRRTRWLGFGWASVTLVAYGRLVQWVRQWPWVGRLMGEPSATVRFVSGFGSGMTALMFAACRGNVPMARVLLAAGADPRVRDYRGRNAREVARFFGPWPLMEATLESAERAWAGAAPCAMAGGSSQTASKAECSECCAAAPEKSCAN